MQQRFDAHIRPDGGRALVVGSAIVGGAAVLAGLVLSEPLLVFLALIAFAVSLYNYPCFRLVKRTFLQVFRDWKLMDLGY